MASHRRHLKHESPVQSNVILFPTFSSGAALANFEAVGGILQLNGSQLIDVIESANVVLARSLGFVLRTRLKVVWFYFRRRKLTWSTRPSMPTTARWRAWHLKTCNSYSEAIRVFCGPVRSYERNIDSRFRIYCLGPLGVPALEGVAKTALLVPRGALLAIMICHIAGHLIM